MATERNKYLHLYLGNRCQTESGKIGWLASIDLCQDDNSIVMLTVRYSNDIDDWDIFNDDAQMDRVKLILRNFSDVTEEEWNEAWSVIGGAPHLNYIGIEDLKKSLETGDWEESGIQMDFFTMSQLINYFRRISIDCDDLIPQGLAIDKALLN